VLLGVGGWEVLSFVPLPATTPILTVKSKLGELEAVLNEPTTHVQLMVELLPGVSPASYVGKKVVGAALEAISDGSPLWLDTTWLSGLRGPSAPSSVLTAFDSTIDDVLQEMVPGGCDAPAFVPVVAADADQQHLRALRNFLEHKRRPVVVRARAGGMVIAEPWARIERIAAALDLALDDLHLVVDEGYVSEVSERRVHDLSAMVTELIRRHEYASLTVLGGSTPKSRNTDETRPRERSEVRLWKILQTECGYLLRYGDYGAVHPEPPLKDRPAPVQPDPYLHYTIPDARLTFRRRIPERVGRKVPSGATERAFRELAEDVVHHQEFAGIRFSWGDRTLASCRTDLSLPVGTVTKWIAMATSHHLAHLANAESEQLRASS